MLILGKKEKVTFGDKEEGVVVNTEEVNLEEFFIANLSGSVDFENNLTLEGLLNHFAEIRDFIFTYFSEHYDKLKAIITSNKNNRQYSGIRFFKKLVIEDGQVFFEPAYDYIPSNDAFSNLPFLAQISVVVDNTVQVIEEIPGEYLNNKELTCEITLQDIMESLFVDLVYDLTEGFTG